MMELGQNLWGKVTYKIMHLSTANAPFLLFSTESMVCATLDPFILNIFIDSLESFLRTYTPRMWYVMMVGNTRPTSIMKDFVAPPRNASDFFLDRLEPALLGCIGLAWGLSNNCIGWRGLLIVSGNIGLAPIWSQMIGSFPIGIWMTLLINIIPTDLSREVITRTEDGIRSKFSQQSAIPLLHLAQLFL